MMDENRLDNIVECSYNMDNGYVEVWYVDGNMLRIKCEEVEVALRTTEQSLAKLHNVLFGDAVLKIIFESLYKDGMLRD